MPTTRQPTSYPTTSARTFVQYEVVQYFSGATAAAYGGCASCDLALKMAIKASLPLARIRVSNIHVDTAVSARRRLHKNHESAESDSYDSRDDSRDDSRAESEPESLIETSEGSERSEVDSSFNLNLDLDFLTHEDQRDSEDRDSDEEEVFPKKGVFEYLRTSTNPHTDMDTVERGLVSGAVRIVYGGYFVSEETGHGDVNSAFDAVQGQYNASILAAGSFKTHLLSYAGSEGATALTSGKSNYETRGSIAIYCRFLVHVEWCVRQLWCSSIIIYSIDSIAFNHYTDIYPQLK